MKIIGHRGAMGLAPENSLEACKKALLLKVDMIEVDIRLLDNTLILSHDLPDKNTTYTTLAELLALVRGSIPINLEIKEFEATDYLASTLERYKGDILFSSFNFSILQKIKKIFPYHQIIVLDKWSSIRAVLRARQLKTNVIGLQDRWLWKGVIRNLTRNNYKVFAYTVNSSNRAKSLESWGVAGIFTDRPDTFVP